MTHDMYHILFIAASPYTMDLSSFHDTGHWESISAATWTNSCMHRKG